MRFVRKFMRGGAALFTLLAILLFLAFPARYAKSVARGVDLWAVSVLPATFPFLFLTALFRSQPLYPRLLRALTPAAGKLFRISGASGCAALLSLLSGYPVGAKTVCELYARRELASEEVFRVAALATTSGPMFVVGVVGCHILKSSKLGWLIFAAHLLSVALVALLLRLFSRGTVRSIAPPPATQRKDLFALLSESVLSVLCVGGAIALFSAFSQMLADALALATPADVTPLLGLVEMTAGCNGVKSLPPPLASALCAFYITFGGACVLLQQCVYLKRAGVKTLPFLLVKLAQGALAFALCYALTSLAS